MTPRARALAVASPSLAVLLVSGAWALGDYLLNRTVRLRL